MQKVTFVLVAMIAVMASHASAQERVLFETLTEKEEADARATNDYFIKKYTFAAKRHRLVKVDIEALESEEQIVIPLFDDEKMVVSFKDREIYNFSGGFAWHGQLVQDKLTMEAILDHVPNVEAAQTLFTTMTNVTVLVDLLERDEKTGANLNPVYDFAEAMGASKPDRYAQRHTNPNYVLGVTADLSTLSNRSPYPEYGLRMLGMGGPYHILYEVDPSRIYLDADDAIVPGEQASRIDQGERAETDEEQRRKEILREEARAFRESLGENPHDALYREKMRQKGMVK